jgi:hypothetical protein
MLKAFAHIYFTEMKARSKDAMAIELAKLLNCSDIQNGNRGL